MKKLYFVAVMLAAMGASSCLAGEDCANPSASAQIDSCARQDKDAAEKALNKAYTEAKGRIATAYQADGEMQKTLQQQLLEAQRGWLKYRENQCKMQAFLAEVGTPAYDTITNKCFSKLNRLRAEQLKEIPYQ